MLGKFCLVGCLLVFGVQGFAQSNYKSYQPSHTDKRHYLSGAFGFLAPGQNMLTGTSPNGNIVNTTGFTLSGFFGLGGDYDYMLNKDFSVGGVLRYYSVSTTINSQAWQNTLLALGPTVRAYLPVGAWLPNVAAGLMYLSPGLTQNGTAYTISSGLGLLLSAGILYPLNDSVSLGIEVSRFTGWANSINGNLVDDYMFKGRFALGD